MAARLALVLTSLFVFIPQAFAQDSATQKSPTQAAAEKKPAGPEKWEKEIAAIEKKTAANAAAKESLVFVGSSSIRLWDLAKSFPNLQALNHGFGGSQTADSVHFFDRLVLATAPKTIVLYAGDNDIASGKSAEQTFADFQAFAALVKAKLPESKLIFIAIKPSPSRWKLFEKQTAANQMIRTAMEKEPQRFVYLDIVKPMLGENGQPQPELFKADMLHLNDAGYAIWSKALLPHLEPSAAKK